MPLLHHPNQYSIGNPYILFLLHVLRHSLPVAWAPWGHCKHLVEYAEVLQ